MEDSWSKRKGAIDVLRDQRQFLIEVIVGRLVENYLNYLSSLLFEIFTQRPEGGDVDAVPAIYQGFFVGPEEQLEKYGLKERVGPIRPMVRLRVGHIEQSLAADGAIACFSSNFFPSA